MLFLRYLSEAEDLVRQWQASAYEIHKRPPYRAHSFDDDARFWVVGSTKVSVLHGWHGDQEAAGLLAQRLNACLADRGEFK